MIKKTYLKWIMQLYEYIYQNLEGINEKESIDYLLSVCWNF